MATSHPVTKRLGGLAQPGRGYLFMKAKTHGWNYVLSWAHRITGIILVLYIVLHIYTLSGLKDPDSFDSKMKFLQFSLFIFLEWLLAVPVIFHTLNGGRLILYETFGNRIDEIVLKWVLGLSALYIALLGLLMAIGNQTAFPIFFWLYMMIASGCITYVTISRIRLSGVSVFWKLHRITGAFLLLMDPGHMLFMHLNQAIGHNAQTIIFRMDNIFIKIVDLLLVISVIYHGGYGLLSISRDYLQSKSARFGFAVLIGTVLVFSVCLGVELIFYT